MSERVWTPTTDDDLPKEEVASKVLDVMEEWGAGQSEMSGVDDDEIKDWTMTVAIGPTDVVAIHIDWESQKIVTAWLHNV